MSTSAVTMNDVSAASNQDAAAETPMERRPLGALVDELSSSLREAHRRHTEILKAIAKVSKRCGAGRRRRSSSAGNLSRRHRLSDQLNALIGNAGGAPMRRPEVTSAINRYAVANSLKDPANKRSIVVNEPLAALFASGAQEPESLPRAGQSVELFRVLRFLRQHIESTPVAEDAPAAAAAAR